MSKLATTHLGTSFETHCSYLLRQSLGMSLSRIGGKGDGGVDLRGWWYLPRTQSDRKDEADLDVQKYRGRVSLLEDSATTGSLISTSFSSSLRSGSVSPRTTPLELPARRLRVLVQCKAEKLKAGPRLIREMEGVARRGFDLLQNRRQDGVPTTLTSNSASTDEEQNIDQDSPYSIPEEAWPGSSSSDHVPSNCNIDPEGLFSNLAPNAIQTLDTITTIICTRTGFSSSATVEAVRSRAPMLLLHVPFEVEDAVRLREWQGRRSGLEVGSTGLGVGNGGVSLAGSEGVSDIDQEAEYPIPLILRAAFSNPALTGTSGVLGEELELRKEYVSSGEDARGEGSFGMGLWWR